jgi:hypothetical protein
MTSSTFYMAAIKCTQSRCFTTTEIRTTITAPHTYIPYCEETLLWLSN